MLDNQQGNGKTFRSYRDVVPKKDAGCILDSQRKQRVDNEKNEMEKMLVEYHPV